MPITIVFDFVEPIAFWQLLDWKSIHRSMKEKLL
jgi:hypothetical protein